MTVVETARSIVNAWTTSVATAIVAAFDRVVSPRTVWLIEGDDDTFVLEGQGKSDNAPAQLRFADGRFQAEHLAPMFKGTRVEIVLHPRRFLLRPLELPARAADFLDGIVRAQIDRLTPWSASEAVFGCAPPKPSGPDNITTTIAVTPRKLATSYVEAVSGFHPAAIAVSTDATEQGVDRVKVYEQKARGHLDAVRLGRVMRFGLVAIGFVALLSVAAAAYLADSLGAQETALARQIAQRRAAIRVSAGGDSNTPLGALERRKHDSPASVIVLDALTKALPDHTHVTELHIVGNRLQVVGITRDAPSLIPLIEQSQQLSRATFYAPTTRSPSDPGERFHIEARIEPRAVVGQ